VNTNSKDSKVKGNPKSKRTNPMKTKREPKMMLQVRFCNPKMKSLRIKTIFLQKMSQLL